MKVIVLVLIIFIYNSVLVFGLTKPCRSVTLKNGSVRYRSKGRIAKFRCNRGFTLSGDNIAACIRGEWDIDVPRCVSRSSCRAITEIANGHVMGSKRWSSLKFICNNGYHLVGRPHLKCTNSKWDGEPPQCLTSVQLSCDFESNGICGWDNSTRSGYFWLKRQFATPSHYLDTGPGHDHTLHPKNNGHYLYIETSGLSSIKTPIARLHSPLFPPVENNGTCFTFWYHMFGTTIGELIVYIDGHKVFHKNGNQGNRWIKGVVKNLPTDTFFQISIEGIAGSGWTGDIAIDDLNITSSSECTRPDLEDTTCDGRCYEDEVKNSTLCECNQECIAKSACCSDFFDICNADISSTGLPYPLLISEDESTITNEDQPGSTVAYESSYINTVSINYSNKAIKEHSKKSKTTDNEIECSTISYTSDIKNNVISSANMTVIQDKDIDLFDTTSVNEESYSEENHSNSLESTTYKHYLFVSQVPANFYTSDLALDYSDSESEKDNKNHRKEELFKENTYSDSETGTVAPLMSTDSTVGTTAFSSNSSFISSIPKNSTLFADVSKVESHLTSQPNKTVLISNISLKTVAPHTHLHRNENSSHITTQSTHFNNNFTSTHLPVATTDLYRNEKSFQTHFLPQVTRSFLSTHFSLETINLSGDSSAQATQKPHVDEPSYITLGTRDIYRYEGTAQSTQKPEVNGTSFTTYLSIVTTAMHRNKNSSQTTHKPAQSSVVTTLLHRRENNSHISTHLPYNVTTLLHRRENNSHITTHLPHIVTTLLHRRENNSHISTHLPYNVTTLLRRRENNSHISTHLPYNVTTLLRRRENNSHITTHLPHNVTTLLHRRENNSHISTHLPYNVTTLLRRRENNSHITTHLPHNVTTLLHRRENNSHITTLLPHIVTTLLHRRENNSHITTHLPHNNDSFVSIKTTLHLYRSENSSLTTHSFHVNDTFLSTTDLPIATYKSNVNTIAAYKSNVNTIATYKSNVNTIATKKVDQSPTIFHTTETTTETLSDNVQIHLARTERTRWKSVYRPKGYYTYSARKQEQTNSGRYKNIAIILGIATTFIIGATIGIYIYRKRSFLNGGYNVEEADVLFIPNDELLDFSVASPQSRLHRKNYINKVLL